MTGQALAVHNIGLPFVEQPSLDELAETIRREHDACRAAAKTTIEHAISAGEALLQVRERLTPTRQWMAWLEANFPKHRSSAYQYMRVATYRHLIPADYGIAAADKLTKGLPTIDGLPGRPRIDDARKADAQRLRSEGKGYKEIARALDASVSTVYSWFNDGTKSQRDKRAREALRKEEKQRAVKRAVAKEGGALAEAYSLAERLDDVLGQAHREAKEPAARKELARAHEFHRAMRDSIVRGLGVE